MGRQRRRQIGKEERGMEKKGREERNASKS